MLPKQITQMVLYGVGLGSLAAVVYFAGPFIAVGSWHPLENAIVRNIVILLLVAGAAGVGAFSFFRRRKASKQIADGISGAEQTVNDEPVLKERMKDALTTLKVASGNKSGYLYDLPWYVIIGPPGAGKTTALVNSGLKFPLSRGAAPAAVAGVGGTRYCDWWFTEEAVLIDTAGRYTTQDSDARSDKESWFSFLDLLKKSRPRQPINGVLIAISIEDIQPCRARISQRTRRRSACDCSNCTSGSKSVFPFMRCSPRSIWSRDSPSISATLTRPAGDRSGAQRFR